MRKFSKMRTRILWLCIGSTLIALMLQAFLYQNTSAVIIYNQSKETSLNSLAKMQEDIYLKIKDIESKLIDVYNHDEFMGDLRDHIPITQMQANNYQIAYDIALNNFEVSDYVNAVYIYDDFNRIISTYRHAITPKYHYPEDIFEDVWAYNAKVVRWYALSDETTMLISSYYKEDRETNIIRFALKIYGKNSTKDKIGLIVCDVNSKIFTNIMEKYVNSEDTVMWLQPVGDRPVTWAGNMTDDNQRIFDDAATLIEKSDRNEAVNLNISDRVFFQIAQDKYNLAAYSLMSQSYLTQNQSALNRNLLIIVIVMIILFSCISMMVTRGMTRPLESLMETIRQIKHGEKELRVENMGTDEIGELGNQFNQMLDQMELLIAREYQSELLLNQAEYKALQAQINPHFLYNTLDTMSSIASVQNCPLVSTLSQSLSNLFRYSLNMKNPLSTLEQEIVHLKNYIYVMNVRVNGEIHYDFNIDKQMIHYVVPRISLQPIVENAINHGLKSAKCSKEISLSVREKEGVVEIIVEDNGKGMNPEELNSQFEEGASAETGSSIGLHNINARVKMLFGNRYGLHIESVIGSYTRVCLRIPKVKEGEMDGWKKV